MSVDEGLYAWVVEALAPIGAVSMRRMMGGATLYLDGHDRLGRQTDCSSQSEEVHRPIIFAILADDEIWFKADGETDARWDAEGCERFSMTFGNGRVGTMNYRRAPSAVYDDAEVMQLWSRLAVEAGTRGTAKRKPRKKKVRDRP